MRIALTTVLLAVAGCAPGEACNDEAAAAYGTCVADCEQDTCFADCADAEPACALETANAAAKAQGIVSNIHLFDADGDAVSD